VNSLAAAPVNASERINLESGAIGD
jgi:hypothetical protein